jgi:hypothetical protein
MQTLRKGRAETVQSSASDTRTALHMPDGPEQEARDRGFRAKPEEGITNPDKWSDPSWQRYAWGTDVMQDALKHISMVQPFSSGNLRRRPPLKPRPTFPFVQDPPRNHGAKVELRHVPLISDAPLPADNEQLEQILPQPVSRRHGYKRSLQINTGN